MWRMILIGSLWAAAAFAACTFPEVSFETGPPPNAECAIDPECPQSAELCMAARCNDQFRCDTTLRPAGSSCGSGLTCDDAGACIECSGPGDCGADSCQDGHCVPMHCTDMTTNGDESASDCGGADCNRCADGSLCNAASDCTSGFCDDGRGGGSQCAPCAGDSDCAASPGTFCDNGLCLDKLLLGIACTRNNECVSGFCPTDDFVCCDSACDGKCRGCLQGKTGAPNGSCQTVLPGTPDVQCLVTKCDQSGNCL